MTKRLKFLHIPKTAGTALKNYLTDHPDKKDLMLVNASHLTTLRNNGGFSAFILRDPIDRFCSGFWGRKNFYLRKQLSEIPQNAPYYTGGSDFTELETEIFNLANTPDDFLSLLQGDNIMRQRFTNEKTPLNIVTESLTFWLGGPAKYRVLESNVALVIDFENLTKVLKRRFEIDLDSLTEFQKRSKLQFEFDQSYSVTSSNREWFTNTFRPADYELINYIKSRNYFFNR